MGDFYKQMDDSEFNFELGRATGGYKMLENFYSWLDGVFSILDSEIADTNNKSIAQSLYAEKVMLKKVLKEIDSWKKEASCELDFIRKQKVIE